MSRIWTKGWNRINVILPAKKQTRIRAGTTTEPTPGEGLSRVCLTGKVNKEAALVQYYIYFLQWILVAIQEVLRISRKDGDEGRVQLQNILSLFISVISRLWWFSSTKLQQHRKHEHKSAQITDCLSLYGRTERIKSINEKIIHEPKEKNQKLWTWWRWVWCCGGGSVNSTSTQLYVCPHRKLLSDRLIQATANLCAGFMFVYIHPYIYLYI